MRLGRERAFEMNGTGDPGGLNLHKMVVAWARRRHRSFLWGLAWLAVTSGCGPVWIVEPGFGERYAKEQNKALLLYFKEWDSTQHRNMQRDVLQNPAVKKELMDTVNVEIEFEFFEELTNRYHVRQPQVCVMCKPDGTKVNSSLYVNPVPTPEQFLAWLRRAKAEALPSATSQTTTRSVTPKTPRRDTRRRPSEHR